MCPALGCRAGGGGQGLAGACRTVRELPATACWHRRPLWSARVPRAATLPWGTLRSAPPPPSSVLVKVYLSGWVDRKSPFFFKTWFTSIYDSQVFRRLGVDLDLCPDPVPVPVPPEREAGRPQPTGPGPCHGPEAARPRASTAPVPNPKWRWVPSNAFVASIGHRIFIPAFVCVWCSIYTYKRPIRKVSPREFNREFDCSLWRVLTTRGRHRPKEGPRGQPEGPGRP